MGPGLSCGVCKICLFVRQKSIWFRRETESEQRWNYTSAFKLLPDVPKYVIGKKTRDRQSTKESNPTLFERFHIGKDTKYLGHEIPVTKFLLTKPFASMIHRN